VISVELMLKVERKHLLVVSTTEKTLIEERMVFLWAFASFFFSSKQFLPCFSFLCPGFTEECLVTKNVINYEKFKNLVFWVKSLLEKLVHILYHFMSASRSLFIWSFVL